MGVVRTIKADVYEATPPSVLLLKGKDCETVQNASQSLYTVLEATDWSDYHSYRPHPPDVTGLNDMSSSYCDYERHELKQLRDNEHVATPTPPIPGCHGDRYSIGSFGDEYLMNSFDINSHRGYTHSVGGASLPCRQDEYTCQERDEQRDVLTTSSQLTTPSILHVRLATPTSHTSSPQKPLQRRHSGTHQEKGLSQPRPSIQEPHPHHMHRNSIGHMTTGHMTTGHMTAGHMTTDHMTGHMTTDHMTTGHMTTGRQSITSGSDYLRHYKGAYPSHPRSPSRISSGISSPKSTGSFESVFESDSHTSPRSHSIVGVATRHHSDATSGIGSPSHISPLSFKENRFTFNTPLSHAPRVLMDPLQGVPRPPVRRRSHDIASDGYVQSSDGIARLSVSETPPFTPLLVTTPTPLLLPTSTVSRAPSILTPPPFNSPPSTFPSQLTSNVPCNINPLVTKQSSYVIPSLLSRVNSTTPTTATPTIPPPTSAPTNTTLKSLDGYVRLSPSPSSSSSCPDNDGYSDSYSICSNTSSMEELLRPGNEGLADVQYNDYMIDEYN